MINKEFPSFILSILVFSSILLPACFSSAENNSFSRNKKMEPFINTTFQPVELIDTAGKMASLKFDQFDMTIIDFWFSDCPGCLTEMKQFTSLLNKSEKKVQIISISINSFPHWKGLFSSTLSRFSFLQNGHPNWKHYVMKSGQDPRLKNDIAGDSYDLVLSRYNTYAYPLYFVLDRAGKIIEAPESVVDYLNYDLNL